MNRVKVGIKIAIGIGLLLVVFLFIDLDTFVETLRTVKWPYILAILATAPANVFLSALKWKWMLDAYGVPTRLSTAIRLYWGGTYMNNFLPSYVGGDVYKFASIKRVHTDKHSEIASSIVLERALGGIAQLLLIVMFGLFVIGDLADNLIWIGFGGSIAIVALMIPGLRILKRLTKNHAESNNSIVRKVKKALFLVSSFDNKRVLINGLIISLLFNFMTILAYLFGFLAFGEPISLLLLMFTVPLVALVNHIPISFNTLGVKEGAAVYVYHLFAISPELTLSVVLLTRILGVIASSVGGFGLVWSKKEQRTTNPTPVV